MGKNIRSAHSKRHTPRPKQMSTMEEIMALPGMKAGVVTGDAAWSLIKLAKEKKFAMPAFNCTSSSTIVACLEAGKKLNRPIMIQFSEGGASYMTGKAIDNKGHRASILGAVAGAHFVRMVAPAYGIPVFLHTDHCAKKLLPWFDGMLEASAEFLKRVAPMNLILEVEIGVTGGVEDGVDNSGVAAEKLFSTPEDVYAVWQALSPISEKFTIAAAFGNVV